MGKPVIFVIVTVDGPDYATDDKRDANHHIFDLRAMGVGKVECKKFPTWEAAYERYPNV